MITLPIEGDTSGAVPVGTVAMTMRDTAPDGWALLIGQALDQDDYPALAAAVPATWKSGGNINLPDMRRKFPLGDDASLALGAVGGAETVALSQAQLPAHTHSDGSLAVASHTHDDGTFDVPDVLLSYDESSAATGGVNRVSSIGLDHSRSTDRTQVMDVTGVSGAAAPDVSGATGSVGSGAAHDNMPPYVVLNFMVKL
jgi:microcystin-dependent protein